jgi:hypothetical protein
LHVIPLAQPDQPERQQPTQFSAALGGRDLVWRQGIGAGLIGVHRVSHRANATRVSDENNAVQTFIGSLRKRASQMGMEGR